MVIGTSHFRGNLDYTPKKCILKITVSAFSALGDKSVFSVGGTPYRRSGVYLRYGLFGWTADKTTQPSRVEGMNV